MTRWAFDDETWQWEATFGAAGPASVVATRVGDLRVEFDAWTGDLLAVVVDVDGPRGKVRGAGRDVLLAIASTLPADGAAVDVVRRVELRELSRSAREDHQRDVVDALGIPRGGVTPGRPHDLGSLAGVDHGTGRVAVDPSDLAGGLLLVADGAGVRRFPETDLLSVEVPLAPDAYAQALADMYAVVVDGEGVPVGMSPFLTDIDASGRAVGLSQVVVAGTRSLDELSLVLTSDPTRLPSPGLRSARAGAHLALAAASAHRLGDTGARDRLLGSSLRRWSSTGRAFDDVAPPLDEPPFEVELFG